MLKKLLASIGVGSAQVDTQIDNPELAPGQLLQGQVLVQGGQSAQDIEKIELVLMTQAEDESQDSERTVAWPLCRLPVCGPFTIGAGETRYFPFQMTLPLETPVNALRTRDRRVPLVWIHTDLAIAAGVDSDDRDQLLVRPGMALQTLLDTARAWERTALAQCARLQDEQQDWAGAAGVVRQLLFVEKFLQEVENRFPL